MMQSCLQALRRLQGQHGLRVVIITGPFMSGEQRDELRDSVAGLPARVLWCVEDGPAWLAAADLVIAMAGYNTVMEAIRLQRRLIVVPRPGPSAEQRIRAQTLARRGLLRIAETEAPESLARQIDVCLCSASPQTKLPSMNGLDAAVGRLRELLQQTEVPTTVAAGARG